MKKARIVSLESVKNSLKQALIDGTYEKELKTMLKDTSMYKKHKLAMLPTKGKATIVINPSTNKVQYNDSFYNAKYYTDAGFKVVDLYVISDEEIKELP